MRTGPGCGIIGAIPFRIQQEKGEKPIILASGLAVLAAALVVRVLPADRNIVMIILLGAIAPTASNINQVAILYNKDAGYASAINVLSTLSCIVTIPLWFMLFEALIG